MDECDLGGIFGGIYGGISAALNGQNILLGIAIGAVAGGLTGLFTEILSIPYILLATFIVGRAQILHHKYYWKVKIFIILI